MQIFRLYAAAALTITLAGCAQGSGEAPVASATETAGRINADEAPATNFVGRYSGSSFETAMGMEIATDGTFGWGLSVGALDMRARGTWDQEGDVLILTSDPKPVSPKFNYIGIEEYTDAPMIEVVWASNANPFQYADVLLQCADGSRLLGNVPAEGWSPEPGECDDPVSVVLEEGIYDIKSETYNLAEIGWKPGAKIRFEFERNDLGVADFTGMTGTLEDGVLKLFGGKWPLEMRKVMPRPPAAPTTSEPATETP